MSESKYGRALEHIKGGTGLESDFIILNELVKRATPDKHNDLCKCGVKKHFLQDYNFCPNCGQALKEMKK